MGSYFLMGQAVPCMPERAFQLFEKAANANIPAAQYNLSILYRYGEGVEKDIDLADTWRMKLHKMDLNLQLKKFIKKSASNNTPKTPAYIYISFMYAGVVFTSLLLSDSVLLKSRPVLPQTIIFYYTYNNCHNHFH